MRSVRLRELVLGSKPVFVATALADTVDGMLSGVERAREAGADCVELRIDRLASASGVADLVRRVEGPHIVACRTPAFGGFFEGTELERIECLEAASAAAAAAVDIEFFTEPALRDRLMNAARDHGTPVLVGYENMQETPPREALEKGIRAVAALGPDLVKLAVRATCHEDLLTVLGLVLEMRETLDVPFAAIALGPHGAPSRPLACVLGSSFTYCAIESGVIPGQLTVAETRRVLEMVSEQRWSCSSS